MPVAVLPSNEHGGLPLQQVHRDPRHGSIAMLYGLSLEEAKSRLLLHGPNELPREAPTPIWRLVLAQFKDHLVQVLLAAAMISFLLALWEDGGSNWQAFVEPLVILVILICNASVGVIQEGHAEQAINVSHSEFILNLVFLSRHS